MAYPTLYPPQVNSPPTELAAAIDATQTTIQVEDASILPDAPNLFVIGYGDYAETVVMTAKAGNNLTVLRAFQSGARAWTKGAPITRSFTAYDHAALQEWVKSLGDDSIMLPPGGTNRQVLVYDSTSGTMKWATGSAATYGEDIAPPLDSWTAGEGWTVTDNVATHTPGSTEPLSTNITVENGALLTMKSS